ncbi:MAG: YfhO family protein [bacterium]
MKREDLLPIGIFIGLIAIFFIDIITMSRIFLQEDITYIFYPMKSFYAENLKKFDFPLWLPYIQCGYPIFAIGNLGFLYPINLLLFFNLPVPIAQNLHYIIHFILAGIFTYFYAQVIGLPRVSALISGIIFMFSGFFVAHLTHIDILSSSIWLPLILIFMEKILKREKTHIYVVLAGIFIGIQILAGHQQITFYSLLCVSLYFFSGVLFEGRCRILNFLVSFGLVMIIAIGLAAIQIIPTYEVLSLSNRGEGISLKFANIANFPPINFITFILPYFLGDNANYFGKWNFSEGYGYVGIFPLILGLFGILRDKNRHIYFFLSLLILSAILMMGNVTPLYTMLWHLPIFNSIRAPARFCYLLTFSISILAGFGFSYLITQKINRKVILRILYLSLILILGGIIFTMDIEKFLPRDFPLNKIKYIKQDAYIFLIFLCMSFIILYFWVKQKLQLMIFKFLVVLFIIIDLFLFNMRGGPTTVKISHLPEIFTPNTGKFLLQDEDIYRYMSIYPGIILIESNEEIEEFLNRVLSPNMNICTHLSEMNMKTGLICVRHWLEVIKLFRKDTPIHITEQEVIPLMIKNRQLLNLFNVKYILLTRDIPDDKFRMVFEDKSVKIIENKDVLPRAFIVHNSKLIKEKEAVLQELSSKEFNPEQYVILEEEVRSQKSEVRGQTKAKDTPKSKIIDYQPEKVTVKVALNKSGFLVLSDTYYPGWQAYVDGKKEKIYRAYHTFRAVPLEKGNHLVEFRYEPLSVKIGMFITGLTILCLIFFVIIYPRVCVV